MSSTESNSIESGGAGSSPGPSWNPLIQVIVTMGLLGGLVWAMLPSRPNLTPAPLRPAPPGCLKLFREFTPSNLTAVPGLVLDQLSPEQKNRALFRLNMEPCPCGCNRSVASCRASLVPCETSDRAAKRIVAEERGEASPPKKR